MKKRLIALAAAVTMLGLVGQGGTAKAFLLNDRSPNVTAAQLVIGLGTFGAYYALTNRHHHSNKFFDKWSWKWYGLTTVGCMSLTPILGAGLVAANEGRELRSSEVFMMLGDCVIPILGGWIAKAAFDANPEWDRGTGGPTRR
jgi:H+/Cl- antiporter ClcA